MDFKMNQIIYIKCDIGTMHITAKKGVVKRIRKINGKEYSVRVKILESLDFTDGFKTVSPTYERTYKLNTTAFQFFANRDQFVATVRHHISNMAEILATTQNEANLFTT